ncbi:MAG: hypothetical protein HFG80_10530 [Eubacterium sp.]|nr:hypothetical protein [Eubacterium sp.]
MAEEKEINCRNSKAENLKEILKGLGIRSQRELDEALSKSLAGLTIGIMTEEPMADST